MMQKTLIALIACAAPLSTVAAPLDQLTQLLEGEYNNNEQVWQQGLDKVEPYPRKHWHWQPVETEESSGMQLTLGIAPGQGPSVPGWRVEFAAFDTHIRSQLHALGPPKNAKPNRTTCSYSWHAEGSSWIGRIDQRKHCAVELPDRWEVDAEYLLTTERSSRNRSRDTRVLEARRATRYTGWFSLKRNKIDPTAADDDYIFAANVAFHDESHIEPILDDGKPTGYAIELARLTYQNTGVAVLKVGVIEQASGKTLAYSWSNPHADRVGINLRWVQAGLTKVTP